jgi:hypothetical protein
MYLSCMSLKSAAHSFTAVVLALFVSAMFFAVSSAVAAEKNVATMSAKSVALLSVRLQNDNEELDPTSDAERARLVQLGDQFKSHLVGSGRFRFVAIPDDVKAKIEAGQFIGDCRGCEVEYGKELNSDLIAWITVQKVSNLILNLNVYMGDVATNKMTFVHSVDIRGNTDESWSRSLKYLVDNYLLVNTG